MQTRAHAIDLAALVQILAADLVRALEEAIREASRSGSPSVEVEHFAAALCAPADQPAARMLDDLGIDRLEVRGDLLRAVADGARRGRTGVPVVSRGLEDWIRAGWSAASLDRGRPALDGAVLLVAGLADRATGARLRDLAPALARLDPDRAEAWLRSAAPQPVGAPAQPSGDDALSAYARDLTAAARSGEIDPVVGRDPEVRQCIDVLCRRRQNNPVLIGEAGVGKTAVAEGLALALAAGEVPAAIAGFRLLSLDLGAMQAGAGARGVFEARLKGLIDAVRAASPPIILFIDEIHMLVGAGGQAGTGDAANLLKPALARGELRTVGATTFAEYKRHVERDPALVRRFQAVVVGEPDDETAIRMATAVLPALERHHRVRFHAAAVRDAVRLSRRFLPARQLPDKAISLLDTAAARVAATAGGAPAELQAARWAARARSLDAALDAREPGAAGWRSPGADGEGPDDAASALEARWTAQRAAALAVLDARSARDGLDPADAEARARADAAVAEAEAALAAQHADGVLVRTDVDAAVVHAVLTDWTGVPVGEAGADDVAAVLDLPRTLGERVLDQPHAVEAVSTAVRVGRARLADPRRPLSVLMFVGTSGVGKTEMAHALAAACFGGPPSLTVINMGEFKEEHKVSLLLGAPPGYVGYGEGGVLTEAVRRRPYGVILLDEVDQAHPGVHDLLYQLMDRGTLRDGEGRDVDFRNSVILLTTNVGGATLGEIGRPALDGMTLDEIAGAIRPELLARFKPAFLGRCALVPFLPLAEPGLRRIAAAKLRDIAARAAAVHGCELAWDDGVLAAVAARCADGGQGARAIDQVLSREVMPKLALACLAGGADGRPPRAIGIVVRDGRFELDPAPDRASDPVH
jgi:type VI secretion system protein VasG